ncbi:MAG TPA: hypothetical protein VNZ44_21140, partial [Pyrinomonadaceae bacterium]|nr:hypothetical protein [Pyrinomonadaceae bacterium]
MKRKESSRTNPSRRNASARGISPAAFALLFVILLPCAARAQWTTSGANTTTTNNVGVGTSAPGANLDVQSPTGGDAAVKVYTSGAASNDRWASVSVTAAGTDSRAVINLTGHHNFVGYFADNDFTAGLNLSDSMSSKSFRLGLRPYSDSLNLFSDSVNSNGGIMTWLRSGSVGIGTASPGYRLDVQGGAVNASGGLCIAGVCKASWSEVGGGSSPWTTSGTNVLYNSGNVGVGAPSPAQPLHVRRDQNANTMVLIENQSAGAAAQADLRVLNDAGKLGQFGIYSGGSAGYGALAANDVHVYSNTGLALMADSAGGVVKFATGGNAERVRIDSDGRVGIGTASPDRRLTVANAGGVYANLKDSADGVELLTGADATTVGGVAGAGVISVMSNHGLDIRTGGNVSRMVILNSGNVGVGTATPTHKLEVEGTFHATGAITGGSLQATYQDVAEWVPSSQKLAAGTVVVLDP